MITTYTKKAGVKVEKNFSSNEFDCKGKDCCHNTKIDSQLVVFLQKIRNHFGKSVTINSGFRCPVHNKAVGGVGKSKHCDGMAADIVVKDINPAQVAAFAEHIGIKGIGLYDTFVHIDTRSTKAFWYGPKEEYRSTFGGSNSYSYSGKLLKMGSKGEDVKWLQRELTCRGILCGDIDGIFGAKTKAALKKFQKSVNIVADGICGPVTASKLKEG